MLNEPNNRELCPQCGPQCVAQPYFRMLFSRVWGRSKSRFSGVGQSAFTLLHEVIRTQLSRRSSILRLSV